MIKDPYTQKNGTLKNKLGISDYTQLNLAEKDITFSKFLDIKRTYRTTFDVAYIKSIHAHIFEDIFDWAGEFRKVPVEKEEIVIPGLSLTYAEPKNIERELFNCLEKINNVDWDSLPLEEKSMTFTNLLTELWSVHPFRDGNTRTTITFASQFAKEHNFPLDLGLLLDNLTRKFDSNGRITQFSIRDKFVLSAIPKEYSPEPEHLNALIYKAIVSGITKNIEDLQNTLKNTNDSQER